MKRIKAEYRYDKTEIRWIVIDPKANPALAKTMKLTGATRWHRAFKSPSTQEVNR